MLLRHLPSGNIYIFWRCGTITGRPATLSAPCDPGDLFLSGKQRSSSSARPASIGRASFFPSGNDWLKCSNSPDPLLTLIRPPQQSPASFGRLRSGSFWRKIDRSGRLPRDVRLWRLTTSCGRQTSSFAIPANTGTQRPKRAIATRLSLTDARCPDRALGVTAADAIGDDRLPPLRSCRHYYCSSSSQSRARVPEGRTWRRKKCLKRGR